MTNLSTFATELRLNLHSLDEWPPIRSMLSAAGERSTANGREVQLVRADVHPRTGRLRCVFAAVTSLALEEVLEAAHLPPSLLEPVVELPCLDQPGGHR